MLTAIIVCLVLIGICRVTARCVTGSIKFLCDVAPIILILACIMVVLS